MHEQCQPAMLCAVQMYVPYQCSLPELQSLCQVQYAMVLATNNSWKQGCTQHAW